MKIKSDIPGVILGLSPVVGLGISGGLQGKIKTTALYSGNAYFSIKTVVLPFDFSRF